MKNNPFTGDFYDPPTVVTHLLALIPPGMNACEEVLNGLAMSQAMKQEIADAATARQERVRQKAEQAAEQAALALQEMERVQALPQGEVDLDAPGLLASGGGGASAGGASASGASASDLFTNSQESDYVRFSISFVRNT